MTAALTKGERSSIESIADRLKEDVRSQLLKDVRNSEIVVSNIDRSIIEFVISDYNRPKPDTGQEPFPVEGEVIDDDGERLSVVIYADCNGRILEFELVRFGEGPVIGPDWATFQILQTLDTP